MTTQPLATVSRNRLPFWAFIAIFVCAFVWLFSDVLLPFVLGAAIAYLLDPVVEAMVKRKIPRSAATIIILGLFFLAATLALALALPVAYREILRLADAAPELIEQAATLASPYAAWLQEHTGLAGTDAFVAAIKDNIGRALKLGGGVLSGIAVGGKAVIGFFSVLFLTPLVAFFMIKEWPAMTQWLDSLLPRGSYDTIKGLLAQINRKIAGFIRGQVTVAVILSVVYIAALTLAGLDFGFLIGLTAGMLSVIPFVGSTFGLVAGMAVAWFQTGEWTYTGMIAAIFLFAQFVEGNFLTPKLLGDSVGLHPLWILFALMAGGAAFGIVGMLIAVPVAAVIGVLCSFVLKQYRDSDFYNGTVKKDSVKK